MKLSHLATIVLGLILICLLVPTTHFLTRGAINMSLETFAPVGWAIGLVMSFVIVLAVIKLIARTRMLGRTQMVIIYTMLTVAVPVMNLGLVRPSFINMLAVQEEFIYQSNATYRTAYEVQSPNWFPVVPTPEGLAYNSVDLSLNRLDDGPARTAQRKALKTISDALSRMEKGEPVVQGASPNPDQPPKVLVDAVDKLWVDQAEKLLRSRQRKYLEQLKLVGPIEARLAKVKQASEQALETLSKELLGLNEFALTRVPKYWEKLSFKGQDWSRNQLGFLPEDQRTQVIALSKEYQQKAPRWSTLAGQLSAVDRQRLLNTLSSARLAELQAMPQEQLVQERVSFTYRYGKDFLRPILRQDGKGGTPDMNLQGFKETLWPKETQEQKDRGVITRLEDSAKGLPWHLFAKPMVMWGILYTTIFLLLMCLAEYFRRKWIERENLAFPLVEIADNIIRHDCNLEMAEEATDSPRRKMMFSPVFILGLSIGILWICVEAMSHYKIGDMGSTPKVTFLNISKEWFKEGVMKEMNKVFFILSPIVIGIAFLVSLEITFSVWVMFLIYTVIGALIKINIAEALIKPAKAHGWAGGRQFPFPMEQMLGAALCFALILVVKSIRTHTPAATEGKENSFIPRKLNFVGMVVLPMAILALLWNLGVSSVVLLVLFAVISLGLTIAAARVRAETGLPTFHVSYEMTKAPIIFGLTGLSGAKAYASYVNIVFLPGTLLLRSLSTHLENMELARRNQVKLKTIAIASLLAFVVALSVGMVSFLVFSYGFGQEVWGETSNQFQQKPSFNAKYPLWVSHFLGGDLSKFDSPLVLRLVVIAIGFGIFGLLGFLRNRFLRFPLHPMGYLLLMLGVWYNWVSSYGIGEKGMGTTHQEAPVLWGSIFVAWVVKKLVIKYGGMNTYKKAKPLFIGLVVGSIFCVFAWDMVHLVANWMAEHSDKIGEFERMFQENYPYTPKFY